MKARIVASRANTAPVAATPFTPSAWARPKNQVVGKSSTHFPSQQNSTKVKNTAIGKNELCITQKRGPISQYSPSGERATRTSSSWRGAKALSVNASPNHSEHHANTKLTRKLNITATGTDTSLWGDTAEDRLYDSTEGHIRMDGLDLADSRIDALRQRIGLVTQDVQLFHGTVREAE